MSGLMCGAQVATHILVYRVYLSYKVEWRELFTKNDYLVATLNEKDIAMMFLEKLGRDFGRMC